MATTKTKTEQMPTFEEFKKAVKEDYFRTEDTKDSRKYFNSTEAQEKIKKDYASYAKDFKEGKINRNVFMKGGVATVSNCLNLMMD